jgi:hypothetical protein
MKEPKDKTCKICKTRFKPFRTTESVCSIRCAIELSKVAKKKQEAQKTKEWNAEKKVRKEKLMNRSDWMNLFQKVFNTYIRKRDEGKACISCGTYNGQFHAGHYQSVGNCPELRFNEDNVHGQCATCNNHLSGNLINYRINLINKIGIKGVEFLERKDHEPLKLTVDEIKDLIAVYKKKIKNLAN